jgi:hypothetical protein
VSRVLGKDVHCKQVNIEESHHIKASRPPMLLEAFIEGHCKAIE